MARSAETRTWLPLDRWRQALGICPFAFNQLVSGTDLVPSGDCGEVWFQHTYQRPDRISREDVARAIRDAELAIREQVGYNLVPDWIEDERVQTDRPARPEVYNYSSLNVRGQMKSKDTRWGHVISGGVRNYELMAEAVAVTTSDVDGDGYEETCHVVTPALTDSGVAVTDANEVRAYYTGLSADWRWEIRPITVRIIAGVCHVFFNRWEIVDWPEQERLDAAEAGNALDGDLDATYVDEVDIYREYNDPSTQVSFLWENEPTLCDDTSYAASFTTQSGAIFVRDQRLGIVGYAPGNWDADSESFTPSCFEVGREPDQLRLYYYSGWRDNDERIKRPFIDMDPYWEKAVIYYSCCLLDRATCDCTNAERFIRYWREDLARQGAEVAYNVSPNDIDNPLGTCRGAIYAWRRILQGDRRVYR